MGKVEATGDGHQRRNHNQAESHRGRGWHHHRRGRGRRHTFSAGAMRKRFEECHYAKGGSKEDPLNLNGIENEPDEPQRPQPEVYSEPEESNFFPRNRRDPLGLRNIGKDKRKRNRERDRSRSNSPARKQRRSNSPRSSANPNDAQTKEEKEKKLAIEEKTRQEEEKAKQIRKERKEHFNQKYSYGNFDRYYGTRIDSGQKDPRLQVMDREWFEKKTVLDVEFCPRRILGIDIDDHLVGVARKNIRHYCDQNVEVIGKFPASFVNHFGPISQLPTGFSTKFPDNVWFRKENFVLECDELLDTIQEEFDVILALSITKWIHLNWGDDGMRRFFRRAFNQLKPGGRFILEAQPYSSYKKRSGMTEATKEHYQKIEFKPADFEMYLLEVVGFERVEHLGAPSAKSKGFEREIDMYVKRPPSFLQKAMGASGSQQTDSSATSSSSTPSTSSSSATSSTNTPTSTSSSNTPNASSTTTTAEETSPSSRAD